MSTDDGADGPAETLTKLRGAVLRALPVDPVAEAEFERWLVQNTPPARGRRLTRKAEKATTARLGEVEPKRGG